MNKSREIIVALTSCYLLIILIVRNNCVNLTIHFGTTGINRFVAVRYLTYYKVIYLLCFLHIKIILINKLLPHIPISIKKIKFTFIFIKKDMYNKFIYYKQNFLLLQTLILSKLFFIHRQSILKNSTIFVHFLARNIKATATGIFNRAYAYASE